LGPEFTAEGLMVEGRTRLFFTKSSEIFREFSTSCSIPGQKLRFLRVFADLPREMPVLPVMGKLSHGLDAGPAMNSRSAIRSGLFVARV
jgi:hypothetical protein